MASAAARAVMGNKRVAPCPASLEGDSSSPLDSSNSSNISPPFPISLFKDAAVSVDPLPPPPPPLDSQPSFWPSLLIAATSAPATATPVPGTETVFQAGDTRAPKHLPREEEALVAHVCKDKPHGADKPNDLGGASTNGNVSSTSAEDHADQVAQSGTSSTHPPLLEQNASEQQQQQQLQEQVPLGIKEQPHCSPLETGQEREPGESAPPLSAAALVDGGLQELDADSCSICLEPFSQSDPAVLTKCSHEYHFQCVLEWAQRKEECPMCWQALLLRDPSSQELLDACARERKARAAAEAEAAEACASFPIFLGPHNAIFLRGTPHVAAASPSNARHSSLGSGGRRREDSGSPHRGGPFLFRNVGRSSRSSQGRNGSEASRRADSGQAPVAPSSSPSSSSRSAGLLTLQPSPSAAASSATAEPAANSPSPIGGTAGAASSSSSSSSWLKRLHSSSKKPLSASAPSSSSLPTLSSSAPSGDNRSPLARGHSRQAVHGHLAAAGASTAQEHPGATAAASATTASSSQPPRATQGGAPRSAVLDDTNGKGTARVENTMSTSRLGRTDSNRSGSSQSSSQSPSWRAKLLFLGDRSSSDRLP